MAVAYSCALAWEISGDTRYADQAVRILNAWGYKLTTLAGDTNIALIELYGYQFACVAEIMRTYPGWAPADIAQFQTMIYNVFYPLAKASYRPFRHRVSTTTGPTGISPRWTRCTPLASSVTTLP